MRALALTIIVLGSLPLILRRPSVGILMWCWLSYMNPHRLSYGFAYDFPFAQVVAGAVFVGMLVSPESKRMPPLTGLTFLWLSFVLWTGITTVFAIYPTAAFEKLVALLKLQLMTVLTVTLMCESRRLELLVWTIVASIGFYGVKGGFFTLTTGGAHRVWGPPGSFIEDNNALALAICMLLPLAYHLRSQSKSAIVRHGLLVAMFLMAAAAAGSYSRGGFLAALSMSGFLWLKSQRKLITGPVIIIATLLFVAFMPKEWHERMNTIGTYQEDHSAMNRIEAWQMAYNAANQRFFGGGFDLWSEETYQAYGPQDTFKNPGTRGAHSIYFSVLGEHGWVGLILFLGTFIAAWRTGTWIIRNAKGLEELAWLSNLARMVQVALVAYATGGAFQSLAYFDYPWHLVAILVIGRSVVERHFEESRLHDSEGRAERVPRLVLGRPRTSDAQT